MAVEQLDVEHLFTLDLQVAEGAQIIKGGPHGTRIIAEVAGCLLYTSDAADE